MNNLVNQLEQYNIYLNLDNLTFTQIVCAGFVGISDFPTEIWKLLL